MQHTVHTVTHTHPAPIMIELQLPHSSVQAETALDIELYVDWPLLVASPAPAHAAPLL